MYAPPLLTSVSVSLSYFRWFSLLPPELHLYLQFFYLACSSTGPFFMSYFFFTLLICVSFLLVIIFFLSYLLICVRHTNLELGIEMAYFFALSIFLVFEDEKLNVGSDQYSTAAELGHS